MAARAVGSGCLRAPPLAYRVVAVLKHNSSTASDSKPGSRAEPSLVVPDFGDTREAYRSKSFSELLRHYVVFKAFTFKSLVHNNKSVSYIQA